MLDIVIEARNAAISETVKVKRILPFRLLPTSVSSVNVDLPITINAVDEHLLKTSNSTNCDEIGFYKKEPCTK